jgi:hypothetical protein
MADTTSQAQHTEFWKKAVEEQINRTASMFDEVGKLEAKGVEQARSAVSEMGKLAEETLNYTTQLSADWRKMSLDAFRKMTDLWSVKA